MKKETKLFAFKLAEKREEVSKDKKWEAREGITAASCSQSGFNLRYSDTGVFC